MYDATLNPNHMVADLVERRGEFIRQCWLAGMVAGGVPDVQRQQLKLQQQMQMQMHYEQQSPFQGIPAPTSTQPIPIAQRDAHSLEE
jgi:hypothetical protein